MDVIDLKFGDELDQDSRDRITDALEHLDQVNSLSVAHIDQGRTLANHRNIGMIIGRMEGDTAVLHSSIRRSQGPSIKPVDSLSSVFSTPSHLVALSGDFMFGDNRYQNLLILDGPAEFYFLVYGKSAGKRRSMNDADDLFDSAREDIGGKDSLRGSIREAEYDYYDVTAKELVALMEDNSISNISKVLSTFYTYLPTSRTTVALLAHLTPVPDSVRNTINGWGEGEPHQDMIAAASGIGLFSAAYSIKENMPHQIDRRLKAVAAASGVAPPASNVVSDLFTSSGMGPINFPARLVPVLASAVCIDNDGHINPDIKTDQLVDLDTLASQFGLTSWVVELMTQMRLIYTAYQATSLQFGLAVLALIINYFESIGGKFKEELKAMKNVGNSLENARYTGMRSKIPDGLQVKAVARVVYIGLGYYRKCLKTEAEKKAFENYATSAIRHHISPSSDADMCDNIIHVLPDKSLVAAIALGQNLPYEEMDIIIQNYTPIEQSVVYKSLLRKDTPGEWASYKKKVADNEVSRSMMKEALKRLAEEEREVEREFDLRARSCRNEEEYYALISCQEKWKNSLTDVKRELQSLEDIIPLAQDPSFEATRDTVLEKMKALFDAIRDTGTTRPDSPVLEAGPGPGPRNDDDGVQP